MRGHGLRWIAILAAGGCTSTALLPADPPESVRWAALLEVDAAGAIVSSSRITPWPPGQPLPVVASGPALVAAWADADLRAAGLVGSPGASAPVHLRAAHRCEAAAPEPLWAARWDDAGLVPIAPSDVPRLAPVELEVACPELDSERLALELRDGCGGKCALTPKSRTRCWHQLTAEDCPFGQVEITVGLDGGLCLELEEAGFSCAALPGSAPSHGAFQCVGPSTCEVAVHVTVPDPEPPFILDRLRLTEAPPFRGRLSGAVGLVGNGELNNGFAQELVLTADEAIVSTVSDLDPLVGCEDDERPKRLLSFDLDTMELVRSATAPPCFDRFVHEPRTDQLYGPFRRQNEWQLARLSRSGEILGETFARLSRYHSIRGVLFVPDGRLFLLGQVPGAGTVETFDPALEHLGPITADSLDMDWMAPLQGRDVVLVSNALRRMVRIEPNLSRVTDRLDLPEDLTHLSVVYAAVPHPVSERILIGSSGRYELYSGRFGGGFDAVLSWERDLTIFVTATWPVDQRLALAGGMEPQSVTAVTALYDPAERRFLPGIFEVGHGPISRMIPDHRGRLWLLLPWAGEVVRLTPR